MRGLPEGGWGLWNGAFGERQFTCPGNWSSRIPTGNVAETSLPVTAPSRPNPSLSIHVLNGLSFAGALIFSCLLLTRWMPYPDIPAAGEKIRYLGLHGNEYETLFTGSSRVHYQILPSLFDQTVVEGGRASKSFNAGLLGMRPPEQGYFLDEILRQPHGRLRWVFIELVSLEARTPRSRTTSARFVSWHDGRRMGLLWTWMRAETARLREEAAAKGERGWEGAFFLDPLSVWLGHVPSFCQKTANLGRGSSLAGEWFATDSERASRQRKWPWLGAHLDGWMAYDPRETMNEQQLQAYQKSYEERLSTPAIPVNDPASDAATEAMRKAVIDAGATPIFFVPPMTSEKYYYPPPDAAGKMIIWNFSDPRLYPELFAPESRHDYIHLNTAGAKQFTRILGQRFVEFSK